MKNLYTTEYFNSIKKQKYNLRNLYLVLLLLFVIVIAGIMLFYSNQPYGTWLEKPLLLLIFLLTIIFVSFSGIYLEITFGRVKRYFVFLNSVLGSKTRTSTLTFISFDYNCITNKGVDFYSMNCLEWSDAENDYVKRSILVDAEMKDLNFEKGEILTVTTSLNTLIAYVGGVYEEK